MLSTAELQYKDLIETIVNAGRNHNPTKGSCKSIFARTIILPPDEVPLLQGRKIHVKGLVGELRAFIANEATQKGFEKHGCNFWGAWANSDGSLDVDYARLLHSFNGRNQLKDLIRGIKQSPDSRKHVISLWDPSSTAKQIPCVLSYQWFVSGNKLEMIWTQRSADVMIGLASDMFSAWLFNQLIAKTVGLTPGLVTMNIGDAHIYDVHLPKVKTYVDAIWSSPGMNPEVEIEGDIWAFDFKLSDYNVDNVIKFELLV